jgi:hypothetical protein
VGIGDCHVGKLKKPELLASPDGAETAEAIRRGVQDAEAGRMIPLDDAVSRLRAKYGL